VPSLHHQNLPMTDGSQLAPVHASVST
jgi:hypothetical protein